MAGGVYSRIRQETRARASCDTSGRVFAPAAARIRPDAAIASSDCRGECAVQETREGRASPRSIDDVPGNDLAGPLTLVEAAWFWKCHASPSSRGGHDTLVTETHGALDDASCGAANSSAGRRTKGDSHARLSAAAAATHLTVEAIGRQPGRRVTTSARDHGYNLGALRKGTLRCRRSRLPFRPSSSGRQARSCAPVAPPSAARGPAPVIPTSPCAAPAR